MFDEQTLSRLADMIADRLSLKNNGKLASSARKTRIPSDRAKRPATDGGLAQLIKTRRVDLGMSQSAVGEAAGVHNTLIYQLEVGKTSNPKVLVLYGLSNALDIPFEEVCRAALSDALKRSEEATGEDS